MKTLPLHIKVQYLETDESFTCLIRFWLSGFYSVVYVCMFASISGCFVVNIHHAFDPIRLLKKRLRYSQKVDYEKRMMHINPPCHLNVYLNFAY